MSDDLRILEQLFADMKTQIGRNLARLEQLEAKIGDDRTSDEHRERVLGEAQGMQTTTKAQLAKIQEVYARLKASGGVLPEIEAQLAEMIERLK
jgi:hypothetical protein